MNKEDLLKLKEKISKLTEEEQKQRDLYLRGLSTGEIEGPMTGYASIDKPWFKYYETSSIGKQMPKMKMFDFLYESNKGNLDDTALVYFSTIITFRELFNKIDEYAKKFLSIGVKEDDVVSIMMPTTPETVYAFYALNIIGAIPDMIDPRANVNNLNFYMKENKSKYLYALEDCAPKLKKALENTEIEKIVFSKVSSSMPLVTKTIYEGLLRKRKGMTKRSIKDLKKDNNIVNFDNLNIESIEVKRSSYQENKFALLEHSSGTTSIPKGIMLTDDNINALAYQYRLSTLDLQRNDKFLSVIPAFAAFGMIASVHLPLSLGLQTIIIPDPSGKGFEKAFKKYEPNHCLTVPKSYLKLAKSRIVKDLSYFKSPGCGGYELLTAEREEIEKAFESKGCHKKVLTGWGASEVSSTTCLESPNCVHDLSSGIPLAKNIVSIFDENNEEMQYGNDRYGQVYICGPTLMNGYLNNDELTKKSIYIDEVGNRWFKTGDEAKIDNDGVVYINGRIDRMIIIQYNGRKVCPLEIENVINSVPEVESCCVVKANSNLGIVPKAFIKINDNIEDKNLVLSNIIKLCNEKLDAKVIPEDFELIDKMPMTLMDKIDFRKLENSTIEKKLVLRKFN